MTIIGWLIIAALIAGAFVLTWTWAINAAGEAETWPESNIEGE